MHTHTHKNLQIKKYADILTKQHVASGMCETLRICNFLSFITTDLYTIVCYMVLDGLYKWHETQTF